MGLATATQGALLDSCELPGDDAGHLAGVSGHVLVSVSDTLTLTGLDDGTESGADFGTDAPAGDSAEADTAETLEVDPAAQEAALDRASLDAVHAYLKEIGRVPLLSAAQEVDLAKRVEAGLFAGEKLDAGGPMSTQMRSDLEALRDDGALARDRLIESNLRLVVSLARRYAGRGLALLDLIQEGNLGLIRAVEKFDYAKGYKFSTYATWWIRQSITRALADQGRTIRLPVHIVEMVNAVRRLERQLFQEMGREATDAELAVPLDMPASRVRSLRAMSRDPVSFYMPIGSNDGSILGDIIEDGDAMPPLEAAAFGMLRAHVTAVLATLSEREQRILRLRYGFADGRPHTLEEVGQEFGVTRERIRQIESKSLAKLREPCRAGVLAGYLG